MLFLFIVLKLLYNNYCIITLEILIRWYIMKVKNNRRTFFPTCGSDDNINIINKNLNITDVPVSEAVNGKLTAQEKTELKNLIT